MNHFAEFAAVGYQRSHPLFLDLLLRGTLLICSPLS